MTQSLTALLEMKARSPDGSFPIVELFQVPETRRLRYAAIDIGGWLDHREVLVSLDRFGTPDAEGWPVELDQEALMAAPRWQDTPSSAPMLPPIVVGPFGSTFSPLMMQAQVDEALSIDVPDGATAPDADADAVADERILGMERMSPWIGVEAFDDDGRLGEVEDVAFSDDLVLEAVVLDDGTSIPIARLRRRAEEGYLVFA